MSTSTTRVAALEKIAKLTFPFASLDGPSLSAFPGAACTFAPHAVAPAWLDGSNSDPITGVDDDDLALTERRQRSAVDRLTSGGVAENKLVGWNALFDEREQMKRR